MACTPVHSLPLLFSTLSSPPLDLLLFFLFSLSSSPTQELTEEGLPLLLLFYNPDDTSVKELFKERIEAEIADQKGESTIADAL